MRGKVSVGSRFSTNESLTARHFINRIFVRLEWKLTSFGLGRYVKREHLALVSLG